MKSLGRGGWLAILCGALILGALLGGVAVALGRGVLRAPSALTSRLGTPTGTAPAGVYREATVGTPTMLNPLLASTRVDRDLSALIFSGLTRTDANGKVVPDLAASWKIEEDGRKYTFTLRDGVTWHDGQPFGARDVLFTIRLIQDAAFTGDPALADFWRTVNVETPDERTVICTLPRPYAPFLAYTGLGLLPANTLAAVKAGDLANNPFNLQPIGTGAFAFESLDTAKVEVALKRYDGYYGTKPRLQGVRFRAYATNATALQAVAQGEADGIGYIAPSALAEAGAIAGAANVYGPSVAGYTALYFNLKSPQFAATEVRQALSLATNRDEVVRDGLQGWGTAGASPILPNSWAYTKQDWGNDPERAKQLLETAGWKVNASGVREKGGQQLAFTLLTDNEPLRIGVAEVLSRQFNAIGVKATVAAKSPQELAQLLATRRYEAALSGWEGLAADPDPYQGWHSSQAETGYNFANWANPAADKDLEDGRLTTDEAKRKTAYADFQKIFATEVPSLILYYPQYHYAVSKRMTGPNADALNEPSDRFRNIAEWQLAP
ncbi:MAG TPA: ABC transporter substrate-binding protein [Thermomicrobiales bacterium]|jgi:peptide/nickel transport system substrate-binding protein